MTLDAAQIAEWAAIKPNGPDLYVDRRDLVAIARTALDAIAAREAAERERDALVHDIDRLKESETHQLNRAETLAAERDALRVEVAAAQIFGVGFFQAAPGVQEVYREMARAALKETPK